jgi:ABC-2 type transport system permease protein
MNWDQLKTILWLRWRLTNNQWARSKGNGRGHLGDHRCRLDFVGRDRFAVALVVGIFGLQKAEGHSHLGIWFGMTAAFLFFWMIGLLTEIQRSETIDLQRLMHLPVRLGQIFVINYLASHLALSIVLFSARDAGSDSWPGHLARRRHAVPGAAGLGR